MAKLFIEDTTLTSIGDAIRAKGGTTEKIAPLDMATAITNLPSGSSGVRYAILNKTPDSTSSKPIFNIGEFVDGTSNSYIFFIPKLSQYGNMQDFMCYCPADNQEYMYSKYSDTAKDATALTGGNSYFEGPIYSVQRNKDQLIIVNPPQLGPAILIY